MTDRAPVARSDESAARRKRVLISCAPPDRARCDDLKQGPLNLDTPFDFIEASDETPEDDRWQQELRSLVAHAQGTILLVSEASLAAAEQALVIETARELGKPILAIWAYRHDRTELPGITPLSWSWPTIANFIDLI